MRITWFASSEARWRAVAAQCLGRLLEREVEVDAAVGWGEHEQFAGDLECVSVVAGGRRMLRRVSSGATS